jgi:hypothetical protein
VCEPFAVNLHRYTSLYPECGREGAHPLAQSSPPGPRTGRRNGCKAWAKGKRCPDGENGMCGRTQSGYFAAQPQAAEPSDLDPGRAPDRKTIGAQSRGVAASYARASGCRPDSIDSRGDGVTRSQKAKGPLARAFDCLFMEENCIRTPTIGVTLLNRRSTQSCNTLLQF